MNRIAIPLVITLSLVVVTVAILGFQGQRNANEPLWLIADMDFQPRYGAQQESAFFADGRTMRTPPEHTVAYAGGAHNGYFADAGYLRGEEDPTEHNLPSRSNPEFLRNDAAYYDGKNSDGTWIAQAPIEVTMDLMQRGQERYEIHCNVCHGPTGAGNGITTKYGMVGVAGYHTDRIRNMADGEIYNTISYGKGMMMGYGHQIQTEDRWAIVAYVRALQRSQAPQPSDDQATPESPAAEIARR